MGIYRNGWVFFIWNLKSCPRFVLECCKTYYSQNTDLDMREFLAIDKALQSIQGELLNNTSKLTEINKRIERDTKKLEEVEIDPTYNDEKH